MKHVIVLALGFVIGSPWALSDERVNLCWTVDAELRIVDVTAHGPWPSAATAKAFADVQGLSVEDLDCCASAAALAGAEVLLIAGEAATH